MLGTAASNSITKDNGELNLDGAISARKNAMPKLIGTPISNAIPELINVPIIYGNAPYDSRPSTAFQLVPVTNPINPSCEKIFADPTPTENTTITIMNKV